MIDGYEALYLELIGLHEPLPKVRVARKTPVLTLVGAA